jgi:hypothetical protein
MRSVTPARVLAHLTIFARFLVVAKHRTLTVYRPSQNRARCKVMSGALMYSSPTPRPRLTT